jgi:hypothetical protein
MDDTIETHRKGRVQQGGVAQPTGDVGNTRQWTAEFLRSRAKDDNFPSMSQKLIGDMLTNEYAATDQQNALSTEFGFHDD